MSNLVLIEQCKQNNRKAQLVLYNKYCDGMYIIAQRYLKDVMEAEDAMQEGFIKAFQKLHQFDGKVSFGAWLKRIVINRCLDKIKAKKFELEALNEQVLTLVDQEAWEVDDRINVDEIKTTIDQLPDKYKYVVRLFLLEGYDHQEISEIVEISEGASRTLLFRGKKMLQDQLKHLHYGTGY